MHAALDFSSIFPPLPTMAVLFTLNIALPLLAIRLGRKMPSLKLLFHAAALSFLIASPFLFVRLGLSPADAEMPGFLDGAAVLPFVLEGAVILAAYVSYGIVRLGRRFLASLKWM